LTAADSGSAFTAVTWILSRLILLAKVACGRERCGEFMRSLLHVLVLGALLAVGRADSVVVFNEIHFHPAAGATEWLELRNQLAVDIDLSEWSLAGGIDYRFPAGTVLAAGGWLLVAENPAGMAGALGPWTGKLDNAGETIMLRNNSGRVMDEIAYGTEGGWPVAADGAGVTLARRGANLATNDPHSWQASRQPGGTPGADNFPSVLPPVVTLRVATGAAWKYHASGSEPGAEWKSAGFDDSAWLPGNGTFHLGSEAWPAPATAGTLLPGGPVTYYFRTHFSFQGDPATTSLQLRLLVDDGAAVHLNGSELVRLNLADAAGHATTALVPRRAAPRFREFAVPAGALLAGDNLLAVEVHQAGVLPAYPAAIVAAGPVAYWRLGESASPVVDLADLAAAPEVGPQDGVFAGFAAANLAAAGPRPADTTGGNFLTGFEGANRAPFFQGDNDGGNDVVLVPDDGNLSFASGRKFTFEAWVKGSPTQEGGGAILAKGTGGGGEQFACDTVSNKFRFFVRNAGGSAFVAQSNVAPNNTWQHLAGVCDATQNLFRLYVNGVQAASATAPTSLLATAHDVSIGARKNSGTNDYNLNFAGIVDEVALFNRALPLAEITAHYQAAFAPSPGGADLTDAVFAMELRTLEIPSAAPPPALVMNEIGGAGAGFGVELMHTGAAALDFAGGTLTRLDSLGNRQDFPLPPQLVPAGGLLAFDAATLGWSVVAGDRIVLTTISGMPLDGRVVKATPRARFPNGTGEWMRPAMLSLGAANEILLHDEIVINEIMYHPPAPPLPTGAAGGQWLELANRSATPVDLTGWQLTGGVEFTFPAGTVLAAGALLVVAENPADLTGIGALGPWSGSLSRGGDTVELLDAAGNPADRVTYFDGGKWPEFADGGGSSLELRDPRADHQSAANWAASDETGGAAWQTFTWRGPANPGIAGEPTQWRELDLCLLDGPGEVLLDDVRVADTTTGQQLIQNGDFNAGLAHWRATGTHRLTQARAEPGNPGNQVLHLIATGPGEYQGNQIESTFLNNTALLTGREYEVSLRARWLAGGGRLNTRLYFNRLARTHDLAVAPRGGTPGQPNSRAVANLGPTYINLAHAPVVPDPGQPVMVSVEAADPDGLAGLTLNYAVAGGAWQSVAMTSADGRRFSGTIPGQAAASIVQFHVAGADLAAAASTCPAGGAGSRALFIVQDGQAAAGPPHKFRLVMTAADAAFMHASVNCLSNAYLGATLIADESHAYYDVGVRLKGSYVGRDVARVGFSVRFQPDQLFRGVHDSVAVDRSQHVAIAQGEIVAKHIAGRAGGIPNMYDDLGRFVHVIASYNSSCQLRLTGYDDTFLASSYPRGSDGRMYEYEVLRWTTATSDGTPEGIKLPGSGYANPDLQDQGADEEAYRWNWLANNQRAADNFGPAMAVGKLFSQSGAAFDAESKLRLDVDQWLRAMAYQTLVGPNDVIYTGTNIHNIRFFSRPHDGRMLYMPWDWDSSFSRATNAALIGGGNVAKVVTVTANNQRVYLNHLHDLIATTFNTAYMSRWTQHYGAVAGDDYSGILGYIGARAAYALGQLPTTTAFAAAAGTVSENGAVTLTGQANIAVATIGINGLRYLPVWTSTTAWQLVVPLAGGLNTLAIQGLDQRGAAVAGASATLVVNNPNPPGWPGIRINEWLALNTTLPDPADGNKDDWFELHNSSAVAVDLSNWALSDAPAAPRLFVIPPGTVIPAGGFLLVWADNQPAQTTPGGALHVNFKLSGDGETLTLSAPDGRIVDQVAFGAQAPNVSAGSYPDSADWIRPLSSPTPGTANVWLSVVGITVVAGQVEFTFTTTPGHRYRVEGSADLSGWLPLTGDLTPTRATHTWSEPATELRKFYRAVLIP
jgi:hypothetical protein